MGVIGDIPSHAVADRAPTLSRVGTYDARVRVCVCVCARACANRGESRARAVIVDDRASGGVSAPSSTTAPSRAIRRARDVALARA